LPANVFNFAEQTRQRLTYGGVERYLAQLAAHPATVAVAAMCWHLDR
jgi:hypothetical protein